MKHELPPPIMTLYTPAQNPQNYNTRQNMKFKIKPQIRRTLQASQSIIHNGPNIWNSLDNQLYINKNTQNLNSISCFTLKYKKCLLGGYNSWGIHPSNTKGYIPCLPARDLGSLPANYADCMTEHTRMRSHDITL